MSINIWGLDLLDDYLENTQRDYLLSLPKSLPENKWVWLEMDRIWDNYGLDNKKPFSEQDIGAFYGHPVWIMNGLYSETDPESISHRISISNYLIENKITQFADYGGGSGATASQIAKSTSSMSIDIVEPYATDFFKSKLSCYENINFIPKFRINDYDAILVQDVLEHVENPIETAYDISCNVREGGLVIFANCFYPVIKCHLPSTFYLRYTFKWIMSRMGLHYVGKIPGAEHAVVFRRQEKPELEKALTLSSRVRMIGLVINILAPIAGRIKRLFK